MAGAGLDRIPLRIPAEWDAAWFETFVRDVLAQADVRNAVEGTGISIAGTPDGPATLAASQDVLNLLNASLLTVTASNLTQGRQLIVEPGVLELTDAGPGSTALLAIAAHGVPLSKLSHIAPYSVLGDDTGAGVAVEIPASSNDTLLGRRSDVLGFGPLTLDMIPDELITYAKLQNATALSVLGRAGNTDGELDEITPENDHEILRRSGTSIGFGSIDLSQSGAVGSSRLALSNIAQITGQAVLGVASAGAGNLAAISAGTNDRVLRQTGGTLNFGQLTANMFPSALTLSTAFTVSAATQSFTGTTSVSLTGGVITLNGVNVTDYARKSTANTFTSKNTFTHVASGANGLEFNSELPGFWLVETDAPADNTTWRVAANASVFRIGLSTDARTVAEVFQIQRSGNTATEIQLDATTLDFNGAMDLSGNIAVGTSSGQTRFGVTSAGVWTMNTNVSNSANAGAATLPSNPAGFLEVVIGGTTRKIPYYAD